MHDFVLLCKKHFIKLLVKRRTRSQVTGDVTSKVALQVREFVESSLQALSRDLYRGGLHYDMRVSCPYCQLEECSGHNQRACSYEDCLHLLELRQDEPLICKKKRSQEVLTVKGQEMWLSHVSEVGISSNTVGVNCLNVKLERKLIGESCTVNPSRQPPRG